MPLTNSAIFSLNVLLLVCVQDGEFRKYVELYAKDEAKFFADFSAAFGKLISLGV
jgi:cytochrome c peroxidase